MNKVKTNFGSINGRRIMTFKVSSDGRVLPSRFKTEDVWNWGRSLDAFWITGHEAFRRWKIARKAWRTRRKQRGRNPLREADQVNTITRVKFWSDDFDMDILKVLPKVEPLLATVKRPLYVHGGESYGRLNHPSAWNSDGGLVAFFSFNPQVPNKPASYWTNQPVRECTWEEAVRDWWPHHYLLTIDGKVALPNDIWPKFERLMYAMRGWDKNVPEKMLEAIRSQCEAIILQGTLIADELQPR